MSIWTRISETLSALASGEPLSEVFNRLRSPPELSVAFTIAVIALGAKMAKADGEVTRDEVSAFREVFAISREDEPAAARVFNLARQDVAGFDVYARRVADMFDAVEGPVCDLMEGLFHIALADGSYHPSEDDYLTQVADILGLSSRQFAALRARFVSDAEPEPHGVLGVTPEMPLPEIQAEWRRQVRETHPDSLASRGLPAEAVKMAEKRLVAINHAWETIQKQRGEGIG